MLSKTALFSTILSFWAFGSGCHREEPAAPVAPDLPPTAQLSRLTTLQWENAVRDLLYLPAATGLSESFIGDVISGGFENNTATLTVSGELWQDQQRAAEELALGVVSDPELYTKLVPQDIRRVDRPKVSLLWQAEELDSSAEITEDGSGARLTRGGLSQLVSLQSAGSYRISAQVWADQLGDDLAEMSLWLEPAPGSWQRPSGRGLVITATSRETAQNISAEAFVPSAGQYVLHADFVNPYSVSEHFDNELYDSLEDRAVYVDSLALDSLWSPLGISTAAPSERAALAEAWIRDFGRRAHRRPLTSEEISAYRSLFELGPSVVASGDDVADGVRLVITAALQSPWFLYRTEFGGPPGLAGNALLTAHELASRLSFALWNTMPDSELDALADSGELLDRKVARAQVERMLASPRAEQTVLDLHRQLLLLDNYENIGKDPILFPAFSLQTASAMRTEAETFVTDIISSDGTVSDLFTTPSTVVNDQLAPIYGLSGDYGSDFVWVDLDPSQRAGLLTQSGFLALHADPYLSSPIQRGAFIDRVVWCIELPPPPDAAMAPEADPSKTTRELVESHTGEGTCGEGCHSRIINPPGFGLESFDAIGRHRDTENGEPINDADIAYLPSGERPFDGAVELAAVVADAPETHRCYAQHLLEYLHGRTVTPEDEALLESLGERSRQQGLTIRDLMVEIVLADSFRMRNAEVQP